MINEIRIQNFKSIRDVTVKLSPVSVLVGRSGTGKSNFVHAVRFLRDLLIGQGNQLHQSWDTTRPAPKTDAPTRFDIRFSVPGVDGEYRYTLEVHVAGPSVSPAEESLTLSDDVLFHQVTGSQRNQSTWSCEPKLIEVPQAGPIALGRMPSLQEVVIAYAALTNGIGCYTFQNSVMMNGRTNQAEQSGLDDSAGNYLTTMKEIVSNLQDLNIRKNIIAALKRVNDSVTSVELNDLRNPAHAVVGHQFDGLTLGLNLSQESEGFRRFFAHLLALYQRPPKFLLLFEHPEDGIHPGALSLLAEEFLGTPDDGRGQVILTTHSPDLLDHFSPGQILVVQRDGLFTQIGPIASEQRDSIQEQLIDPGELLTVDPARMETATPEVVGE